MSTEYRVMWEVDLVVDSVQAAAQQALAIQRDPDSGATRFQVVERRTHRAYFVNITAGQETVILLAERDSIQEEDPEFPLREWYHQVAHDDVRQGYGAWVRLQKECRR
jgi:hypothetical protein